jgi:hypothetical protein
MARQHKRSDGAAVAISPEHLRQVDLSHLRLQDMTPEQRAELRRRYDDFVRHFGAGGVSAPAPEPKKKPRVRKWTPGAKP